MTKPIKASKVAPTTDKTQKEITRAKARDAARGRVAKRKAEQKVAPDKAPRGSETLHGKIERGVQQRKKMTNIKAARDAADAKLKEKT
jgi:hypothetical protein